MIRNIYDVTLKLITPSDEGKNVDFLNKEDDILEAVYFFNEKFRMWNKRMIIYMISKKSIHLLLIMEKEKQSDHITAREIRFFTTYLNNQKAWNVFSRNASKLFESVNFTSVSLDRAQRQVDVMSKDTGIYEQQIEEIDYLSRERIKEDSGRLENDDFDISDEDVKTIINYLVNTKNKGQRSTEKMETLSQIKRLIEKWM